MTRIQTLDEAVVVANRLAEVHREAFGVQEWSHHSGGPFDFVVAHGWHDGIGKTVYCALIPPKQA